MTKIEDYAVQRLNEVGDPLAALQALGISLRLTPTLRPGMDFQGDHFYYTVTVERTQEKVVGRGKSASTVTTTSQMPLVIRATLPHEPHPHWFLYDEDTLREEGFIPSNALVHGATRRWSEDSLAAYLAGRAAPIDTAAIFDEIRQIIWNYIEFDEDDRLYDLTALFVLFTYVYRVFRSTPYFHFTGTAGSGKSQTLRVMQALGFNSTHSGSITESALFRTIAGNPGLVCVDEAEDFDSERGKAVRSLLLSGYSDSSTAKRVEKDATGRFYPVEYDVFSPKAIASINPLDQTLASRCFIVPMRAATRPIAQGMRADDPMWQPIRDRLYLWGLQNAHQIAALRKEWNATVNERVGAWLANRPWEIAEPIVVLADYTGRPDLLDNIIGWLKTYFEMDAQRKVDTDTTFLTLRTLPRVIAAKQPWDHHYYKVSDVLDVLRTYLDEDTRERMTTNRVSRALTSLGFTNRKRMQGGSYIALPEDQIRKTLKGRRIEPFEEDASWYGGADRQGDHRQPPSTPATDWETFLADSADEQPY